MRKELYKDTRWTYHWEDLDGGRKQQPNKPLLDGNHISGRRESRPRPLNNRLRLTCFQSRLPKANVSGPRTPMRSKPTSMKTSRMKSVINIVMIDALLLSTLAILHEPGTGAHSGRI